MQMWHVEFNCRTFFLCAASRLVFSLCLVRISTNCWPSDSLWVYSMPLVLSLGFAFVDEYGPCLLLSVVYRILLASIADTWTSGPINRWYSNPVNRLYSNTSSETRSSDSRLYGYIAQGDMFYLEKCKKMRVIW